MANKCNMTLRIEPDLKRQASELFQALGLFTLEDIYGLTIAKKTEKSA